MSTTYLIDPSNIKNDDEARYLALLFEQYPEVNRFKKNAIEAITSIDEEIKKISAI